MKQEPKFEDIVKKKRGRKPKQKTEDSYYFSANEENAVCQYIENNKTISELNDEIEFVNADLKNYKEGTIEYKMNSDSLSELNKTIVNLSNKNNEIFNKILKPAFYMMIESIIRKYKLSIPNENITDTIDDTLGNLITKIDKFNSEKNTKAYSYYGTLCKNYLKSKIILYQKLLIRNPSYDDDKNEIDITNTLKMRPSKDKEAMFACEMVELMMKRIKYMLEKPKEFKLKEYEIKVGKSLLNLLDNWEFVISTDGSNKLNKQACILFLREETGLDTKHIRDGRKKYIREFKNIKEKLIKSYSK